jgi:hypothetical protein
VTVEGPRPRKIHDTPKEFMRRRSIATLGKELVVRSAEADEIRVHERPLGTARIDHTQCAFRCTPSGKDLVDVDLRGTIHRSLDQGH